eukprot:6845114-Pyramimonas_sp.AAC.1
MERLDADDPSVVEMQLARLEYAAMTTAAHHCDIGTELPNRYDTNNMLSPTRPPRDAVPLHSSGPNRPDGTQDPMDDETRAYAYRVLIHERRQNI